MRVYLLGVVTVAAFGCKKDKEPRYEGAMPVTFGDCAGVNVAFVSGPRPAPFTAEEANSAWDSSKLADTDKPKPDLDDPPPPEDDEPPPDDPQQPGGAFASLTGTGDV